ncbi:MAG: T9SS type A sorting domain-containing protein [Bacteroidetes bacterium]|nr:T9SS type A sorting domain-containing protein [Bacteroidota bacterium]
MKFKTTHWLAFTLSFIMVNFTVRSQTYCPAMSATCECEITNVNIIGSNSQISNGSACTPGGYADYLAQSVTLLVGTTYNGTTTSNPQGYFQGQISVWIDWNMDGDFLDANEAVFNGPTFAAGAGSPVPFSVNVPAANPLGPTRMRIRTSSTITAITPCGNVPTGETEDYTIIIANTPPPPPTSYCTASGGCDGGPTARHISNVTYGVVNNTSTCGSGSYSDFTAMKSDVAADGTINIIVTSSAFNPVDVVTVFVDWNKDFDFNDQNESIILQGNGGTYTGALTPSTEAIVGETRMRVAMIWGGNGTYSGCGSREIGEVEDYTLKITAPAPNCVINPTPANNATNICRGTTLSWSRDVVGSQPSGYKVFFGSTTNPPLVSDQTGTTYDTGPLLSNTDYFWKVIPYNSTGDAQTCTEYKFKTTDLAAGITPKPAEVCAGGQLVMNGNPTGGPGVNPTHSWTGPGAAKLSATNVQSPTFTSTDVGPVKLIYTVTDVNGCKSSDSLDVNVKAILPVTVSIAITAGANPTCAGENVEFRATIQNGGTAPGYSWRVDGTQVSTAAVFSTTSLQDGEKVDVLISSNELCPDVASKQSNEITIVITNSSTPTVTISTATSPNCAGDPITFNTASSTEGSAPVYDWKVDGISTATGPSFTSSTLQNGNIVSCVLTSNSACATVPTAQSNQITVQFTPKVDPEVEILITQGSNPACVGETYEFTAQPTNGGTNPTYEWFLNSGSVSTSNTYAPSSLNDGDEIYCVLNSNAECANQTIANSDILTISIVSNAVPTVEVGYDQGSNTICEGETVIFKPISTNEGQNPTYEWFLNTVSVSNTKLYANSTLDDLDEVYCILTSSLACATSPTANSPNVTMSVVPLPAKPTITVDVDVLTSSADLNNQWQMNGVDIVGANDKTYQMLENNDYSVYTTENNCASEVSEVYVFQTLGIPSLKSIKEVFVSPNPSKGIFELNMNEVNAYSFEVYNVLGAKVVSRKFNAQNKIQIDLSAFKNGVYLLKVNTDEGVFTTRLVKN